MKNKAVTIAELRNLIRDVILEVVNEAPEVVPSKKVTVDPTGSGKNVDAKAKTEPAPALKRSLPTNNSSVGSRDMDDVMARLERPTVPAKASAAERAMDQEMKSKGLGKTGAPKLIPTTQNHSNQKASMVGKVLSSRGISYDADSLQSWISGMDPADSMIKTAEEIASDFNADQTLKYK